MRKLTILTLSILILGGCAFQNEESKVEDGYEKTDQRMTVYLCYSELEDLEVFGKENVEVKESVYVEVLNANDETYQVVKTTEYMVASQDLLDQINAVIETQRAKTAIVPVVRPYDNGDGTVDIIQDTRYEFHRASKQEMIDSKLISESEYDLMIDGQKLYDYLAHDLKMSCEFDVYNDHFKHSVILPKHDE